jgi:hypothetical protein
MISEVERDSQEHADGQNVRQVVRKRAFGWRSNGCLWCESQFNSRPEDLKTFAAFVNIKSV